MDVKQFIKDFREAFGRSFGRNLEGTVIAMPDGWSWGRKSEVRKAARTAGFSKIQQHALDVIKMAEGYDNLSGIVINAFTEPFAIEPVIFDMIENLKSRLIKQ